MAWTLAEVQTVLTNLKATYIKLTLSHASEVTTAGRTLVEKQMETVKAQIDEFHALEVALDPTTANASSIAAVGGVAFAEMQRPS